MIQRQVTIVVGILLASSRLSAQAETSSARAMFFAGLEASTGKTDSNRRPSTAGKPQSSRPGSRIAISTVDQHGTDPSNLGIRYSVLKISGLNAVEVPPQTRFRQGDRIRLKVQVNSNGFIYLVHQGSSGAWSLLFPAPRTDRSANRVTAGKDYLLPDALLRFDAKPGTEKLFLIVSREPEVTLDKLIYGRRSGVSQGSDTDVIAAESAIDNAVISRLRNSYAREFVREVLEEQASSALENAVYVVNRSSKQESRVVVDLALVHR